MITLHQPCLEPTPQKNMVIESSPLPFGGHLWTAAVQIDCIYTARREQLRSLERGG